MRESIVWPRFPAFDDEDKASMCEAEITAIYGDLHSFVRDQREENARLQVSIDHLLLVQGALTTECEDLHRRIDRMQKAQPPKSWLRAALDAIRDERIRCAP